MPSPGVSCSPRWLLQNRDPPLMLIGGEALLASARIPPPVPARRHRVVHPRRLRDGRQRPDSVPGRAHRRRDPGPQHEPVAAGPRGGRRRRSPARVQRAAPARGRTRVAGGGIRPAQPDVRAPPVARARVLRPAADRPADVARHRRPPVGPLLPRLRARVPAPVGDHDRGRGDRDGRARARARARGTGADPVRRVDRVPLRAPEPAGLAGGAAAHRGAHRGGRGEHRRRARGEGVRAGAAPAAPLQPRRQAGVRPVDGVHPAARLLLALHRLPTPARPRGAAARRRAPGDQRPDHHRRVHRVLRLRADAGRPDARARHGARAWRSAPWRAARACSSCSTALRGSSRRRTQGRSLPAAGASSSAT